MKPQTEKFIILSYGRGDYITGIKPDGEIMGGDAKDAIQYSAAEADESIASLGRGYSIELAPSE